MMFLLNLDGFNQTLPTENERKSSHFPESLFLCVRFINDA